jgi:hypothetical protein
MGLLYLTCENIDSTWFDVLPVDYDVVVSLCCTVLVPKSQCMQQLVYNCAVPDAAVTLKVQLLALWVIESLCLMSVVPYILVTLCLIQFQLELHYILYFFLDKANPTCFGCYLHASSVTDRAKVLSCPKPVPAPMQYTTKPYKNLWLYAAVVLCAKSTRNMKSLRCQEINK